MESTSIELDLGSNFNWRKFKAVVKRPFTTAKQTHKYEGAQSRTIFSLKPLRFQLFFLVFFFLSNPFFLSFLPHTNSAFFFLILSSFLSFFLTPTQLMPLDETCPPCALMDMMPMHKEAGWKTPIWDEYKKVGKMILTICFSLFLSDTDCVCVYVYVCVCVCLLLKRKKNAEIEKKNEKEKKEQRRKEETPK